jgi:hypothetical protein
MGGGVGTGSRGTYHRGDDLQHPIVTYVTETRASTKANNRRLPRGPQAAQSAALRSTQRHGDQEAGLDAGKRADGLL